MHEQRTEPAAGHAAPPPAKAAVDGWADLAEARGVAVADAVLVRFLPEGAVQWGSVMQVPREQLGAFAAACAAALRGGR